MKHFLIIDFDGYNVGLRESFVDSFLEFDSFEDALEVAEHWSKWISKGDDERELGG